MHASISAVLSLSTAFLLTIGSPLRAEEVNLDVGDPAPHFKVKDDTGKTWNSKDHYGKKTIVLYFYPADMTGGCTAQACGYRDSLADLDSKDVEVVGISGDSVENHQLFKKAHDLNFTLLADTDGKVAKKFGVPITEGEKTVKATIDGVEHLLVRDITTRRWTFVIGPDGKIAYKDDAVNAREDPAKIAAVVQQLQGEKK